MKKYIKFFIKKLPLLSAVIVAGISLRIAGAISLAAGVDYDFIREPVYGVVLDGAMDTFTMKRPEPAKEKSVQKPKEGIEQPEKEEEKKGYISAEETAARSGQKLDDVIEKYKKSSNDTYVYSQTYPEDIMDMVLPAVDYMIADGTYIDRDGTTYEYPNTGVFEQNNDYYKFCEVDEDYFDNALFIGDSRADGLCNYSWLNQHAAFFALESITIYNVFDEEIPYREAGNKDRPKKGLEEILRSRQFGKIYLSPGMNELGTPNTTEYRKAYLKVIERIRALQPEAIIFVQGIVHVNIDRSAGDPVFNNKAIIQRNDAISKLINGHDIFFVEPNTVLCNSDGNLIYEYTNDGIHLTAQYYPLWADYLKTRGIVRTEADE